MITFENQTDFNLDLSLLENISNELTTKEIELILTNNKTIQGLNNEYRSIDKPTDVLSFPLEFDFDYMPLGSIVISLDYAKEKADVYKHSLQEEITLLFIHGLLHLLNYDHEIDNGEHRTKEEELILKYNLPKSLIVRNS